MEALLAYDNIAIVALAAAWGWSEIRLSKLWSQMLRERQEHTSRIEKLTTALTELRHALERQG